MLFLFSLLLLCPPYLSPLSSFIFPCLFVNPLSLSSLSLSLLSPPFHFFALPYTLPFTFTSFCAFQFPFSVHFCLLFIYSFFSYLLFPFHSHPLSSFHFLLLFPFTSLSFFSLYTLSLTFLFSMYTFPLTLLFFVYLSPFLLYLAFAPPTHFPFYSMVLPLLYLSLPSSPILPPLPPCSRRSPASTHR